MVEILSSLYGIDKDYMLITRGIDEGIDLLLRTFCREGKDSIMICPPTYGMYEISANIQGANIVEVPLLKEQGFALDVQTILDTWKPEIKLIFLCSPANPTGNLLDENAVLKICEKLNDKALIIIDEVYIEFASKPSMLRFLKEHPNLVVLRTLSKAYGLAGVRCGTIVANPDIVNLFKKVIAPYPIPVPVAQTVVRCLKADVVDKIKDQIVILNRERESLKDFLESLEFVQHVFPSEANFLLVKVNDSNWIMQLCLKNRIVIRDRSKEFGLQNCVRISIGTPEENKKLKEVLLNAKP